MTKNGILKSPEAPKRWIALVGLLVYLVMLLHPVIAHSMLWQADLSHGLSAHHESSYEVVQKDAEKECPLCAFIKNQNQESAPLTYFQPPRVCTPLSEALFVVPFIIADFTTSIPRAPPVWS